MDSHRYCAITELLVKKCWHLHGKDTYDRKWRSPLILLSSCRGLQASQSFLSYCGLYPSWSSCAKKRYKTLWNKANMIRRRGRRCWMFHHRRVAQPQPHPLTCLNLTKAVRVRRTCCPWHTSPSCSCTTIWSTARRKHSRKSLLRPLNRSRRTITSQMAWFEHTTCKEKTAV